MLHSIFTKSFYRPFVWKRTFLRNVNQSFKTYCTNFGDNNNCIYKKSAVSTNYLLFQVFSQIIVLWNRRRLHLRPTCQCWLCNSHWLNVSMYLLRSVKKQSDDPLSRLIIYSEKKFFLWKENFFLLRRQKTSTISLFGKICGNKNNVYFLVIFRLEL